MLNSFRSSAAAEHFWVLTAAALSVFVLYAPQPLLPLFADLYGVSEATAGLLMTVTMLPLAIAPLSYGYLLGFVRPIQVLRFSLLVLAGMTCMTGVVQNFPQMLGVRFVHGLIIPALLTAFMAFLADSGRKGNLQQAMSLYVTATISGGFLGRFLAGISSALVAWQFFYFLLGALLLCCFFMIRPEKGKEQDEIAKPRSSTRSSSFVKLRFCTPVYLAIFCLFFVFCGTLNYLPFRTIELVGFSSGLLTGFMYCGYITGIVTSMSAGRLVRKWGGESRVMLSGYGVFLLVLAAMLIPSTWILFALLFPFCGAMFLVHSVATAVVNSEAGESRGVASGFYVSSYYGGGVLGTYLPGLIFEYAGWGSMVVALVAVGSAGVGFLLLFFRRRSAAGWTSGS